MRKSKDLQKWYTKKKQKLIRQRGQAIQLMTEIETLLNAILLQSFIAEAYKTKFDEILLWEDFRLSTKVRLLAQVDVSEPLRKKQQYVVRTLQSKLLPARNKYAHLQGIVSTKDDTAAILVDRGYKLREITDKEFRDFQKECNRIFHSLQEILADVMIHQQ